MIILYFIFFVVVSEGAGNWRNLMLCILLLC